MKKFFTTIVILAIVGVVIYFVIAGNKDKLGSIVSNATISPDSSSSLSPSESPSDSPDAFMEPVNFGQLKQVYDSNQSFSFKYPDGFKVSSSQPASGQEVVTIENDKSSGFQIFAMSFDEPGPITPERIKKDMPDTEINDPKNADLDGAKALVFYSSDQDMGETFEVWVISKGKLYQIAGPKAAEQLIVKTLETWRWK